MGQVQLLNRLPNISIGKMSGNFDGSDDYAISADIARDTIRSEITGNTLPTTFYAKYKILDVTPGPYLIFGFQYVNPTNDNNRIYLRTGVAVAGVVYAGIGTKGTSSLLTSSYSSNINAEVGLTVEIALPFTSTTATNNTAYVNSDSGNLANAGTLTAPADLTDTDYNIILQRIYGTTGYSISPAIEIIELAIFPQNYTLAECKANIASAPFRLKFDDGQGTELTNSGTAGTGYNLDLYNTTETNFWQQLQLPLPQKDFLGFGIGGEFFRKYNYYDTNSYSYSAQLTKAEVQAILGVTLPHTAYMEVEIPSGLVGESIVSACSFKRDSVDTSRSYYVCYYNPATGKLKGRIGTLGTTSGSSNIQESAYTTTTYQPGDVVKVAARYIASAPGGSIVSIENENLAITGVFSLDAPSTWADASDYRFRIGIGVTGKYLIMCRVCAIFNANYTVAECVSNISNAKIKYLCNDGLGTTMTNTGIIANRDLTVGLGVQTERGFHQLSNS